MKKLKVIFLSFAVSAALASNSFGSTLTLTYDGSVHKYTGNILTLKVNGEAVSTDIPPVIIQDRTLVPVRVVFEKLGADVKWDEAKKEVAVSLKDTEIVLGINNKSASVNKKTVEMDVPAKIINSRTMIPVRFVSEQLGAKVGWYPENGLVTIDDKNNVSGPASLNKIECAPKGDVDQVTLYVDNYKDSNISKLDKENGKPYRIVVDLPNTNLLLKQKPDITGSKIKAIRYSQDEENKTRVVLDMLTNSKYKVEEMDNKLVLSVSRPGLNDRGGDVRETAPKASETPKPTETLKPTETPKPTAVPSPTATPAAAGTIPNPNSLDVNYSHVDGRDEVSIITPDYSGYNVVRYTDPDKIVIDMPNARTQEDMKTISVNSSLIKNIRYSMYDENTARVVIDVIGQPAYRTDERDGKLAIVLEATTYKNITYYNVGDRIGFVLPNVKLSESDSSLKKLYSESYDETGNSYTIMFPSSQGSVGTGTLQINDGILNKVEMYSDPDTGMCTITFEAKDKYIYNAVSRSSTGNTVITMLKPAKEGEKLVVIDPGHGGSEPGAQSFGVSEKEFNLDISKRLNALLKANGISTYIIREDDVYVGLFERTSIAKNLNATLFLSIHNNANDRTSIGTETLYYPGFSNSSGFTSKRFAQIIQSNLISALGTKNRGIVERPGLAVLRTAVMPAALAEVAFMDNKSDFAKLSSEDFRQKAAQALCDSVIQALSETN